MTDNSHDTTASVALARVEALAASNPKVRVSSTGSWLEDDSHHHLAKGRG